MRHTTPRRAAAGLLILAALIAGLHLSGVPQQVLHTLGALARLRPESVALVVTLSVLSYCISGAVWTRLLQRLGYRARQPVGLAAFLTAGLAGYVVNAAGPALGCAMSLRRHGVCPGRAVLLALMANALGFCAVLVWAPLGLLLLARTGMDETLPILGHHGPAAAAGILVGLAAGMVLVLRALTCAPDARNRLARKLLGPDPRTSTWAGRESLRLHHLLALVPLTAAAWLAGALGLYVMLGAISPGRPIDLTDVIGATALAAALGSVAFFVPDGMGVRDGALVALLAHSTGIPVAQCAAAAIIMRALDPAIKLGLLLVLAMGARLDRARAVVALRAQLRATWSRRPDHPTLRLPWYLWRAAVAVAEREP